VRNASQCVSVLGIEKTVVESVDVDGRCLVVSVRPRRFAAGRCGRRAPRYDRGDGRLGTARRVGTTSARFRSGKRCRLRARAQCGEQPGWVGHTRLTRRTRTAYASTSTSPCRSPPATWRVWSEAKGFAYYPNLARRRRVDTPRGEFTDERGRRFDLIPQRGEGPRSHTKVDRLALWITLQAMQVAGMNNVLYADFENMDESLRHLVGRLLGQSLQTVATRFGNLPRPGDPRRLFEPVGHFDHLHAEAAAIDAAQPVLPAPLLALVPGTVCMHAFMSWLENATRARRSSSSPSVQRSLARHWKAATERPGASGSLGAGRRCYWSGTNLSARGWTGMAVALPSVGQFSVAVDSRVAMPQLLR
jgi:hypothetical protein